MSFLCCRVLFYSVVLCLSVLLLSKPANVHLRTLSRLFSFVFFFKYTHACSSKLLRFNSVRACPASTFLSRNIYDMRTNTVWLPFLQCWNKLNLQGSYFLIVTCSCHLNFFFFIAFFFQIYHKSAIYNAAWSPWLTFYDTALLTQKAHIVPVVHLTTKRTGDSWECATKSYFVYKDFRVVCVFAYFIYKCVFPLS